MGDHENLRSVDVEPRGEPCARRVGHHHDDLGSGADPLEDAALVGRRSTDHGVGNDDDRNIDAVQETQHRLAVRSGVDAVLVLDDHDVGSVQDVERIERTAVRERRQHERVLEAGVGPHRTTSTDTSCPMSAAASAAKRLRSRRRSEGTSTGSRRIERRPGWV